MNLYYNWLGRHLLPVLKSAEGGYVPFEWSVDSTLLTQVCMPWIEEVVLIIETSTVSVDCGMLRVGGEDILVVCQTVFPIFVRTSIKMHSPTTHSSTKT